MARNTDGESVRLNQFDTRVLVALLAGPLNAYQIARQCEADSNQQSAVSNGALFPALKRLQERRLIQGVAAKGLAGKSYKITAAGREVLSWELDALNGSLQLARERLRQTVRLAHK